MANDVTQYRQIILAPGYDSKTGVFGLVCSADNGQTFRVYWTPYGRVWYPEDASSFFPLLWPYIEEKIKAGGFKQDEVVNWSDIQGRPDVALKSDLPDLSKFAKISDIPKVDLSGYAKITDIPNDLVHTKDLADYVKAKNLPKPPDLSGYALKSQIPSLDGYAKLTDIPSLTGYLKQPALADYAKKSDIPRLDGYAKKSDIPDLSGYAKRSEIPDISSLATKAETQQAQSKADQAYEAAGDNSTLIKQLSGRIDTIHVPSIDGLATISALDEVKTTADSAKSIAQQAQSTAEGATNTAEQAVEIANQAKTRFDTVNQFTNKKPSDYSEGFYREIKSMAIMGINRSQLASDAQDGNTALVLTYSYGGFARQTVMVLDSQRPMTYKRNGKANQWYPWEVIHTTGGDWLQG